jgi:hypothetical protein
MLAAFLAVLAAAVVLLVLLTFPGSDFVVRGTRRARRHATGLRGRKGSIMKFGTSIRIDG